MCLLYCLLLFYLHIQFVPYCKSRDKDIFMSQLDSEFHNFRFIIKQMTCWFTKLRFSAFIKDYYFHSFLFHHVEMSVSFNASSLPPPILGCHNILDKWLHRNMSGVFNCLCSAGIRELWISHLGCSLIGVCYCQGFRTEETNRQTRFSKFKKIIY